MRSDFLNKRTISIEEYNKESLIYYNLIKRYTDESLIVYRSKGLRFNVKSRMPIYSSALLDHICTVVQIVIASFASVIHAKYSCNITVSVIDMNELIKNACATEYPLYLGLNSKDLEKALYQMLNTAEITQLNRSTTLTRTPQGWLLEFVDGMRSGL